MSTWRELSVCATKVGTYGMVCGLTSITVTCGAGGVALGASFSQPAANAARSSTAYAARNSLVMCSPPLARGSGHDVDAAVDVHRLAGDAARVRRGEERDREADVHDVDQLADRRALHGLVQQQVEVPEPRGGARLERARRDRVHADLARPELIGEVA